MTLSTTEEHFGIFKSRVLYWIERLALKGWQVGFAHEELTGVYAQVATDYRERCVLFTFSTDWDDGGMRPLDDAGIDATAKHEVVHVLVTPLRCLAQQRFTSKDELFTAEEELVRRIQELVPDQIQDSDSSI